MKERARMLRKQSTNAERRLWRYLRNRQLESCKFRRQFEIGVYIVDFVCLERRLIVEIDGGQHAERKAYDDDRTSYLQTLDYDVIRFWNTDVLQNVEGVLEIIRLRLHPSPQPSPRKRGEGAGGSPCTRGEGAGS